MINTENLKTHFIKVFTLPHPKNPHKLNREKLNPGMYTSIGVKYSRKYIDYVMWLELDKASRVTGENQDYFIRNNQLPLSNEQYIKVFNDTMGYGREKFILLNYIFNLDKEKKEYEPYLKHWYSSEPFSQYISTFDKIISRFYEDNNNEDVVHKTYYAKIKITKVTKEEVEVLLEPVVDVTSIVRSDFNRENVFEITAFNQNSVIRNEISDKILQSKLYDLLYELYPTNYTDEYNNLPEYNNLITYIFKSELYLIKKLAKSNLGIERDRKLIRYLVRHISSQFGELKLKTLEFLVMKAWSEIKLAQYIQNKISVRSTDQILQTIPLDDWNIINNKLTQNYHSIFATFYLYIFPKYANVIKAFIYVFLNFKNYCHRDLYFSLLEQKYNKDLEYLDNSMGNIKFIRLHLQRLLLNKRINHQDLFEHIFSKHHNEIFSSYLKSKHKDLDSIGSKKQAPKHISDIKPDTDLQKDTFIPEHYKAKIIELEKELKSLSPYDQTKNLKTNVLKTLKELPHRPSEDTPNSIEDIRNQLDDEYYGLDNIKEAIVECVYNRIHKSDKSEALPILFYGAPGTGKTTIAKFIAKVLKRDFIKISMGGIDSSYLMGFNQTYLNSQPGIIIKEMCKIKSNNPVILFDEIDKIQMHSNNSPYGVLMELLDPVQVKRFKDHFLEFEYDLSQALIICTCNEVSNIREALYNRLQPIKIDGYTKYEKISIAKHFLLPKIADSYKKKIDLNFSDLDLKELIEKYTHEGGVRQLKNLLSRLATRMHISNISTYDKKLLTESKIVPLNKLGKESEISEDGIYPMAVIQYQGVVNKLSVNRLKKKYEESKNSKPISIINSVGKTLAISTTTAWIYFSSSDHVDEEKMLEIDEYNFKLSISPTSIPIDGPSMGLALTLILNQFFGKINMNLNGGIAVTGEIDAQGNVGQIGGLVAKLSAAVENNAKIILIPEGNREDLKIAIKKLENEYSSVFKKDFVKIHNSLVYCVSHFNRALDIISEKPSKSR